MPDLPENSPSQPSLSIRKIFLKTTLLSLVFVALLFAITLLVLGVIVNSKLTVFSRNAKVSKAELWQTFKTGWRLKPIQTDGKKNILILGVDSLQNRGDVPPLSDTIVIASIDLSTGNITTLPLPRDLWSETYRTKINALYAYGIDRNPNDPTDFPQETLSNLTGLDLHHTIILSLDELASLIDIIGEIEVEVSEGFVDTQFPRSNVNINIETDPEVLFETVTFEKGTQLMSGERALKYIRSRKSQGDEGTDLARSARQQQVIQAIVQKLLQTQTLTDPRLLAKLYLWYQDNFDQYLSREELVATGKALTPNRKYIEFESVNLSIYPESLNGIIFHPPVWQYNGQWVYEVRDLDKFREEINNQLK